MMRIDLPGIIATTNFLISLDFLLLKIRFLRKNENLEQVESLCRKRLQRNPTSHIAHYYLAKSLRRQGKLEEAAAVYRRIPELPSSKFFSDTTDLLWALLEAGRYREAISLGEKALKELDGKVTGIEGNIKVVYLDAIHRVVGASYAELEEYQKAIPHLERAREINLATYPEKILERIDYCRSKLRGTATD